MATSETRIKQKLNRRDEKLKKACELAYRRLTFGPFSASGLPDRVVSFGSATIGIEVKADGKKLTKLQEYKLQEGIDHGMPGMAVIGEQDVKDYYKKLLKEFTEEQVEMRMIQYERDCLALREALEELIDER